MRKVIKMSKKKVFVTGAMGFIGMNWCKKLLDNDYIVYGLDLKKSKINHKNFIYYKDTVFNYSLVNRIIKKSYCMSFCGNSRTHEILN